MPTIQSRDCPQELYDRLSQCAQEDHRSISQELIVAIEGYLEYRERKKEVERMLDVAMSLPPKPWEPGYRRYRESEWERTETGEVFRWLLCQADAAVLAPSLLYAEAGNAFWKYHKAGLMDKARALEGTAATLDLVDEFVPMSELYEEALAESMRLHQPIYDMFYLVLARRNGAVLYTTDKWLNALCEQEGVEHIRDVRA